MGNRRTYSRRSLLAAGLGTASAAAAVSALGPLGATAARAATLRGPGAMPYPSLPVGQYTGAFPFDHMVLVMQENHSFDNYLGMLPVCGQPQGRWLHVQRGGRAGQLEPGGRRAHVRVPPVR